MDIQQIILALNEQLDKYNQLKETQDLRKTIAFLQCSNRDITWYNSTNYFIKSLLDKYPTLKYYIDKHRDGRNGNPDYITMLDYLVIAGMCIVTELYVETHKNN